jgi:hypothetical protein
MIGPVMQAYWTRESAAAAIRGWASERGHSPSSREWTGPRRVRATEGHDAPCVQTVIRLFGSWNAALLAAGVEPNQRSWTREDVVAALSAWAERNGRQPRQNDWKPRPQGCPSISAIYSVFGSWNAAIEAAGGVALRVRRREVAAA